MPRIEDKSTTTVRRAYQQVIATGKVTNYANKSYAYTYDEVNRSDVTKVTADSSGWRRPTAYTAVTASADVGLVDIAVEWGSPGSRQRFVNYGRLRSNDSLAPSSTSWEKLETTISDVPSQSQIDQAIVKARNNVANRVASFGESLAELRGTVGSLGNAATKLSTFVEAASRKDWRGAARAVGLNPSGRKGRRARDNAVRGGGTLSSAWLAYNFAVVPIVNDMVSLLILLNSGRSVRLTGKTVLLTKKTRSNPVYSTALGYNPVYSNLKLHFSEELVSGVHVRLDYEMDSSFLNTLAGFGLSDALQVGWAITPHSFLVDFVLPVSEVLRSLTATFGLKFKGGSSTTFVRKTRKFKGHTRTLSGDNPVAVADTIVINPTRASRMNRIVYTTEPNPVTLWVKDPLDAFKVTTVFALLGQRLSKSLPKI